MTVLILGCGYTGKRVAASLTARGIDVIATDRRTSVPSLLAIPQDVAVLYSIPVIPVTEPDPMPALLAALEGRAGRVVYLSTTGVYGSALHVDENTPALPNDAAGNARIAAEQAILSGPWSSLILRPAAIYGPGRGVHVRLMRGDYKLVDDGANYVSRIHVDDLAAHAVAAVLSTVTGAFPVADEHPCTSREIIEYCANLLHLPLPDSIPAADAHRTQRANRRVDGSAIRRLLGVSLKYPSYLTGIPASLDPD